MTDAPLHPSTDCAPVAAEAATQQVPVAADGGSSKRPTEPNAAHAEDTPLREAVASILEDALRSMGATKNVALIPEFLPALARDLAQNIDPVIAAALVKADHGAVRHAAATLNSLLDLIAAESVIALVWRIEGFEEIDERYLERQAKAWIAHMVAPHVIDNRFRWPDPFAMVTDYLRARSGGGISVALPSHGTRRAAWFVDPVRCRAAAKETNLATFKADADSDLKRPPMPAPQLIQCPGLPGTASFQFPDGRCVKTISDGYTVTTFWKSGKLHRDPASGPAVIVRNREGCVTAEEFWKGGKLIENDKPSKPANRRARRASKKAKRRAR